MSFRSSERRLEVSTVSISVAFCVKLALQTKDAVTVREFNLTVIIVALCVARTGAEVDSDAFNEVAEKRRPQNNNMNGLPSRLGGARQKRVEDDRKVVDA